MYKHKHKAELNINKRLFKILKFKRITLDNTKGIDLVTINKERNVLQAADITFTIRRYVKLKDNKNVNKYQDIAW